MDPGKKNLSDERGRSLRYTCRQRSKLQRYLEVLKLEKDKEEGLAKAERDLSEHSRKTNEFVSYLREKKLHDDSASSFYRQTKWRGWKFRIYCSKSKSQDSFLNRVEETYGRLFSTETGPEKTK